MENSEFRELSEEELDSVTGGINWKGFGKCILSSGGSQIPALSGLVMDIIAQNWVKVAIDAVSADVSAVPIVIKCQRENP